MSEKRTPEQVHAEGGHEGKTVKSCEVCQAEQPDSTEAVLVGEPGPELVTESADEVATTEAAPEPVHTTESRRRICKVCNRRPWRGGLCQAHYQTHRGLADKEA